MPPPTAMPCMTWTAAPSPWDPEPATAMARLGIAVEEEVVAGLLAADVLDGGPPAP